MDLRELMNQGGRELVDGGGLVDHVQLLYFISKGNIDQNKMNLIFFLLKDTT